MLSEQQTIEVEASSVQEALPHLAALVPGAGNFDRTGPRSKDEPDASLRETQAWGPVAAPQNGGRCGDAATTVDMHPLQQRIESLSLLTE